MARLPMRIFLTSPSSKMLLGYPVTRSGRALLWGARKGKLPPGGFAQSRIRTLTWWILAGQPKLLKSTNSNPETQVLNPKSPKP